MLKLTQILTDVKYKTTESAMTAIEEDSINLMYVSPSLQMNVPEILLRVIEKNPEHIKVIHYTVRYKRQSMYECVMIKALAQQMINNTCNDKEHYPMWHLVSALLSELSKYSQRLIKYNATILFFNLKKLSVNNIETDNDEINIAAKLLDFFVFNKPSLSKIKDNNLFCSQKSSNSYIPREVKKHIASYLSIFDFACMAHASDHKDCTDARALLPKNLTSNVLSPEKMRGITPWLKNMNNISKCLEWDCRQDEEIANKRKDQNHDLLAVSSSLLKT